MRRFFGMELFQSGGTYSSLPSVPKNEIVLFEKDTVVNGYSLLTSETDGVIYYTSGSGAGGDPGAAAKPSGTWTQPNHTHTVSITAESSHTHDMSGSHTHPIAGHVLTVDEMPSHRHQFDQRAWGRGGAEYEVLPGAYEELNWTTYTGGDQAHTHGGGTTGTSSSGTSGAGSSHTHGNTVSNNATSSTWRPVGRCFTRQQRI